ncbi:hypothetical protein NN561_018618 [Cricetulus griseus]
MLTEGESEGLQTLGIVVVVCSSLKLLHYLGLIDLSDDKIEDELEMTMVCHRPEGLEQLEAQTNFTKRELQVLYRGFKNECPSGVVNEETFKQIYAQFFPHGDASTYAHYLFNAFDTTQTGSVKFEDFVSALSILLRGTVHEKLRWTFNLYDINKDGYINKEEMMDIVKAIYDMMGKYTYPVLKEDTPRQHVDVFFQDYTATIYLRQRWTDPRLVFEGNKSFTLDARLVEFLWVPDTYIVESKKSFLHEVTVGNRLIRLFSNGTVLYALRITTTVTCNMDLSKYPMDTQTCKLQLESWGYDGNDVEFTWLRGNDSVRGLESLRLAQYTIQQYFTLVTVSQQETGVTTVLSMTTLMIGSRTSLPNTNCFIKAIDVYLGICFSFVFGALLEYAVAHYSSLQQMAVKDRTHSRVVWLTAFNDRLASRFIMVPFQKLEKGLLFLEN